jgi:hypothetical protein
MSCAHCAHCPTAQGQAHGYDPEAYDLLQDAQWVEVEIAEGAGLWCPWRKDWCVVYPVVLAEAQACHRAGEAVDIKIHPSYKELIKP